MSPWSLRHVVTGAALLLTCLGYLGCGSKEANGTPAVPSTPVDGGTLTIGVPSEPDNLNPLIRSGSFSGSVLGILNPGLVLMNTELNWEPMLASGWTWSPDRLELTYTIRPGLKWSDGEPFTAHDVVLSAELYKDPAIASNRITSFADMDSVLALDDLTVKFHFTRSSPEQIFDSAFSILPAHIVASLDRTQVASWPINRAPVTLGPYRLKEWVANSQLVLERNPHWTGEAPHLDSIVFKVVPDESARVLQLEIGEVDMLESVSPKDVVRLREKHPDVQLYELDPRMIGVLSFNLARAPLDDQRVRQAISYSVDRRALIEGVIYGYAMPLATPMLPMHAWAQHPDLEPYPRDLEHARALLAEAGFVDSDGDGIVERDGAPLKLAIRTRTGDLIRENGVVILQRNLRDIGIDASVQMMELAATLDLVRQGDFDIYYGHSNVSVSVDLSDVYATGGGFNYSGFSNVEIDSLMRLAVAIEDKDLARPYWLRVQEILHDQQPTAILYALKPLAAINSRFRDCTPHMLSPWEGIEKWWQVPDAAS